MLDISLLGIVGFVIFNTRKWKLFKDHLFSNAVKVMLLIYDTQYYVPLKACRKTGSMHSFKIKEKLTLEHVRLKPSILLYILELEWNEVNMTLTKIKIKLPTSITITTAR